MCIYILTTAVLLAISDGKQHMAKPLSEVFDVEPYLPTRFARSLSLSGLIVNTTVLHSISKEKKKYLQTKTDKTFYCTISAAGSPESMCSTMLDYATRCCLNMISFSMARCVTHGFEMR